MKVCYVKNLKIQKHQKLRKQNKITIANIIEERLITTSQLNFSKLIHFFRVVDQKISKTNFYSDQNKQIVQALHLYISTTKSDKQVATQNLKNLSHFSQQNMSSILFRIFSFDSPIILLSIFLLLTLSTSQSCQLYETFYTVCYKHNNDNFIFYNCTRQQCISNTNNSSTNGNNSSTSLCSSYQTIFFTEGECSSALCSKELYSQSLLECMNQLNDNSLQEKSMVRIIVTVAGMAIFLIMLALFAYCCYRKHCVSDEPSVTSHALFGEGNRNPWRFRNIGRRYQASSSSSLVDNLHLGHMNTSLNQLVISDPQNQAQKVECMPILMEMPHINLSQAQNQTCCICLNSQNLNCQTKCNHFYHSACIFEWMKRDESCPQCRNRYFTPIKIFCLHCGKIRDAFRLDHKAYVCVSLLSFQFYVKSSLCHQCVVDEANKGNGKNLDEIADLTSKEENVIHVTQKYQNLR